MSYNINGNTNEKECELEWLKDDQSRVTLMCGVKGSSKTYTLLNWIRFCMLTKRFTNYYLILPSYSTDHDKQQYEFLNHSNDKIKIYTRYSPLVMKQIVTYQLSEKEPSVLIIDDATSSGHDISSDESFINAITTTRHLQLSILFVTHNLLRVVSPTIRANCDHIFLFKVSNSKLLESFYNEYLSMYPDFESFKHFKSEYQKHVLSIKYNALFLNLLENSFNWNVKNWNINTYNLNDRFTKKIIQPNIKTQEVDTKKDIIKQKIIDSNTRQKMIQQIKK